MKIFSLYILIAISSLNCYAQQINDQCINAEIICNGNTQQYNNSNATLNTNINDDDGDGTVINCSLNSDASVWFTFETNSIGGNTTLTIDNINCIDEALRSKLLKAYIIEATTPCNASTYLLIDNCMQNSDNIEFNLTSLKPNTTYYLSVSGDNSPPNNLPADCNFSITINGEATTYVNAGEDIDILKGETAQLNGFAEGVFYWTPTIYLDDSISLNPYTTPPSTTTYVLSTYYQGCTSSDDVTINVSNFINIPNALTPNDDGYNDVWNIGRIEEYPLNRVEIFNRLGQKVYSIDGYSNNRPWDVFFNGKLLPMGTYIYVINLNTGNENQDIYKGSINIVY